MLDGELFPLRFPQNNHSATAAVATSKCTAKPDEQNTKNESKIMMEEDLLWPGYGHGTEFRLFPLMPKIVTLQKCLHYETLYNQTSLGWALVKMMRHDNGLISSSSVHRTPNASRFLYISNRRWSFPRFTCHPSLMAISLPPHNITLNRQTITSLLGGRSFPSPPPCRGAHVEVCARALSSRPSTYNVGNFRIGECASAKRNAKRKSLSVVCISSQSAW